MTDQISPARRAAITARVIEEIRADVRSGVLPHLPVTFGELHDFVDANTYGGMCDDTANADVSTDDWYAIQDDVQDWLTIQATTQGIALFQAWLPTQPQPTPDPAPDPVRDPEEDSS